MTFDTNLIKKPHAKLSYTEQQLKDFVRCFDSVNGPKFFMENFFYIQHPVRGKIQYKPYDFQIDLLDNYHTNRFSVNLVSRQMGKCCSKDINITVKNNNKIYDIPIGIFYQYQKDPIIDISCYERKQKI